MSRELRAYRIDLQLFERDDPDSEWHESKSESLSFFTVAATMAKAADYVERAWMKKDDTDRAEFEWRAVGGQQLTGEVLLP